MKKTLILVLIFLLLVTIMFITFNSLKIGNNEILGIKRLREENQRLDTSIQTLSRLSSTDYNQALVDITNSSKQYEQSKNEYEELATVSTDSEITTANQLQKYEIEYLWTRIGNHASAENVVLKLEIMANSTSEATGYYDLNFVATGDYVGITDFIYDIENDSSLGFKIEGFKMEPDGDKVKTSFTCTNIAINIDASAIKGQNNSTTNQENSDTNTESENKTEDSNTSSEGNNNSGDSNTNTNTTNN